MFGGKKLDNDAKKHLRDAHIHTKSDFEHQIKFLKETKQKRQEEEYRCDYCIYIAKKLGMWGDN